MICASEEQDEKAELPIDVTDDGIAMRESERQDEKAESPIDITDDGIMISVSRLQLVNE